MGITTEARMRMEGTLKRSEYRLAPTHPDQTTAMGGNGWEATMQRIGVVREHSSTHIYCCPKPPNVDGITVFGHSIPPLDLDRSRACIVQSSPHNLQSRAKYGR
jgi:hypothetical protein